MKSDNLPQTVTADTITELQAVLNFAQKQHATLDAIEIQDDKTRDLVVEMSRAVKGRLDDIDARRRSITDPLNRAKRATDDLFRPVLTRLREMHAALRARVSEYETNKAAAHREALEQAASAAQGGDTATATAALAIARDAAPSAPSSGLSLRSTWDWDVEDFEKIPREYLTVDKGALKIYLNNLPKGTEPDIPGLRFREHKIPVIRGR